MASLRRCLRLSCEALERGIYLHVILELRSVEEGGMLETDLARQLEGLFHEVGEGSSTPASPRASSSTCSSWSPTSSRSRPLAPTGPDTTPGSSSGSTHDATSRCGGR